jgi:predicted metal-binding membrane protein
MMLFALLNIAGILLGWMLTLFVLMFAEDPRTTAGRKRSKK